MAVKKTNNSCPTGYAWDPNALKCVKINTESIVNKKTGLSYFASPQGTVYENKKNTQMSIDTTGYGSGKKEFILKTTSPSKTTTKKIPRSSVKPLLSNMKKEVKSVQKNKVKTAIKKAFSKISKPKYKF